MCIIITAVSAVNIGKNTRKICSSFVCSVLHISLVGNKQRSRRQDSYIAEHTRTSSRFVTQRKHTASPYKHQRMNNICVE
jgi:hypothetical protein